jgi:hypothetical protein
MYVVEFFSEWEAFQKNVAKKLKHAYSINYFFSEDFGIYEIMRKKHRRHFWVSITTMVMRMPKMLGYAYIACFFILLAVNLHSCVKK